MIAKYLYWALKVAKVTSELSRDPSTIVGAVILTPDARIVATGYNEMPIGVVASYERPLKYDLIIHAEANALYNCCRIGISTIGCVVVCTHEPCSGCRKAMINSGIVECFYGIPMVGEKWASDLRVCALLPLRCSRLAD